MLLLNRFLKFFSLNYYWIFCAIETHSLQSTPLNLNRKYMKILFKLQDDSNFQVLESSSNKLFSLTLCLGGNIRTRWGIHLTRVYIKGCWLYYLIIWTADPWFCAAFATSELFRTCWAIWTSYVRHCLFCCSLERKPKILNMSLNSNRHFLFSNSL